MSQFSPLVPIGRVVFEAALIGRIVPLVKVTSLFSCMASHTWLGLVSPQNRSIGSGAFLRQQSYDRIPSLDFHGARLG